MSPTSIEDIISACEENGGTCSIMRSGLSLEEAGDLHDAIHEGFEQGLFVATSRPHSIEVTLLTGARAWFERMKRSGSQ